MKIKFSFFMSVIILYNLMGLILFWIDGESNTIMLNLIMLIAILFNLIIE